MSALGTALAHESGRSRAEVARLALETLLGRETVLKRGLSKTIGDDKPL